MKGTGKGDCKQRYFVLFSLEKMVYNWKKLFEGGTK